MKIAVCLALLVVSMASTAAQEPITPHPTTAQDPMRNLDECDDGGCPTLRPTDRRKLVDCDDGECPKPRPTDIPAHRRKLVDCDDGGCPTLSPIDGPAHRRKLVDCNFECPEHLAFVCGTNDESYTNECYLRRASCKRPELNLKVKLNEECPSPPPVLAEP